MKNGLTVSRKAGIRWLESLFFNRLLTNIDYNCHEKILENLRREEVC
jgi:hypothetical protein